MIKKSIGQQAYELKSTTELTWVEINKQIAPDLTRGALANRAKYYAEKNSLKWPLVNSHSRHGMKDTPEYRSWNMMLQRCGNPNNPAYKHYGGRGIKVCDRWKSFVNFYADMGDRPYPKDQYSIDRIDNNGDYEPGNCRWATYKQQAQTQRRPTKHC